MIHIQEILQEFKEKFANPDPFSSSGQFNPELAGKLFQEFESFLTTKLEAMEKEIREEYEVDNNSLKCSQCGKKDKTVSIRACGYAADVNNNPNSYEQICDDCEHEHLMDI